MKILLLTLAAAGLALVTHCADQVQRDEQTSTATTPAPPDPRFQSPQAMQAEFIRRFEASPGFGLSRVVRPVFLAPAPALVWNNTTYPVAPPTLIALEDEPVAYAPREIYHRSVGLTTNQPRSEVRKMFAHRPLTALETNAVLALREGRDLVVFTNHIVVLESQFTRLETVPSLFVVGALRAGHSCAACHQCKEGTLLGAFAYSLTPLPVPAAPNTQTTPSNNVAERLLAAPAPSSVAWNSAPHRSRL